VRFLTRAGAVLAAWTLLVLAEQAYVLLAAQVAFAGAWEVSTVRRTLTPLAVLVLLPLVPLFAAGAESARRWPRLLQPALAVMAGALGYGVSAGRHFASLPLRVLFVLAAAALGWVVARWVVAPSLAAGRRQPWVASLVGMVLAFVAWWLDGHAYAHLYPAAHLALLLATLAAAALLLAPLVESGSRTTRAVLAGGFVLTLGGLALVPRLARTLAAADNVRFVALEHGPILGRVVEVAALLAPPRPLDEDPHGAEATPAPGEIPRALDWSGHDLLLVTIDALRADHVSGYGYARKTTPELDALAGQGTVFREAYCPTPHTSYSITSMMTGKYMRPLLAMGIGEDSETWAQAMRRYDYRTAAFYPPAVFFVDEERFVDFAARGLDFEYRRVEFKDAGLRSAELASYLATEPAGRPLFVWVHLFEPHEPYVFHPQHPFGDPAAPTDEDRYDSEIATADAAVGDLVRTMRSARPGAIVVVTADHGEAFGEHGARYHGGDVHDEQVRVPLLVVGPGVAVKETRASVQTIDLLPTVLSALGMPRPARLRGRDLGPLLAAKPTADSAGLPPGYPPPVAFSETDDYARVTRGTDVLICQRQVRACALYDHVKDPGELHDVSAAEPAKAADLRRILTGIERDNGRFERGEGADWPEPIRRGLQGDVTAAEDVAPLLDDAQLAVRQEAALVLYRLHDAGTVPALRRALARDEDPTVRKLAALGVARAAPGEPAPPLVDALLHDGDVAFRRRAALTFAERGDPRGEAELVSYWAAEAPGNGNDSDGAATADGGAAAAKTELSFEQARILLAAMRQAHLRSAAPVLVRSLGDVRLRADIAATLGVLGVKDTAPALLAQLTEERYVSARAAEAEALVSLGAREELRAPLERFAGVPEPLPEVVDLAARAGLLVAPSGWRADGRHAVDGGAAVPLDATLALAGAAGPSLARLLLAVTKDEPPVHVSATSTGGAPLDLTATVVTDTLQKIELPAPSGASGGALSFRLASREPVVAAWLVRHAPEIPPPPPRPWHPRN
jgi:arylsulfatase A-like enzyme/HEAT repeat protein